MRCQEKIAYPTQAEAEAKRKEMVRRKFHGKALRWLRSYRCSQCFRWHVGHDLKGRPVDKAVPQTKIPSTGELRRKLKRIEHDLDRQRRHHARVIGQLIEADRIMAATENEMQEIQRQVTAMFLRA